MDSEYVLKTGFANGLGYRVKKREGGSIMGNS